MSKTEKQLMKEMFENAVASNDLDTMRGILKIGAKIKLEGHLYDSIKNRNVEAVKLLIEYGANPNNIKDPNYRGQYINALRLAMDGGNVSKEILEILLDIPSNPSLDIDPKIDISRDNGYLITALSVGVEKDILEMLISRGAATVFVFTQAIRNQDIEIIELLFNTTSPPDEELELAFLDSIHYDSTDVVRFISSKLSAASIDKLKSDNRISVDKAKTVEIAEILFDLGFKIRFILNNRGHECIENIPSIEFLKFLLEKGMSPIINRNSYSYSYNSNPLYLVYLNDKDALKLFLDHGLDPNLIIHHFCHDQEIEFVKLLLSYSGADVNAKDEDGYTPLRIAVEYDHIELVRLLISSGADVNVKRNDGWTPLHWATSNNRLEVAKLLISSGADLEAKDNGGNTPLHWAARNNCLELAQFLISSGADVNAKDNWNNTPLHQAAMNNHLELAQLLISSGGDLDAKSKNNSGFTPLHWAARYGSLELAKLLISSGADLEAEDNGGKTPLHIVAEYNRLELAELLISSGADLEAKTSWGWTPLHWATCNNSQAVAQLLISSGADVNAKRNDGFTPLHYVCNSVNIQMVEYLLKVGADPNITDVNGNTPLHTLGISECYASRQIRQSSRRWSRYKYENPNKKVIAEMLYKAGSSISIKNNQGKTPITIVKVYANDKYGNTTLKEFYDKEQEQMKQNLSSQVSAQVLTAPKKKTPRVSVSVKTEADLMKEIQEKIKNALSDA